MTAEELTGNLYTYRFEYVRAVDGDTIDAAIDLGFHTTVVKRVRLLGINAPETRGPERPLGRLAWSRVVDFFVEDHTLNTQFFIQTQLDSSDKYGRVLGRIWRVNPGKDPVDLAQTLINEGLAVPYAG